VPERHTRIARELFLFGFGGDADQVEPWVIARMASFLVEEDGTAGRPLFRQGEPAGSFHFVRRGRVRMTSGPESETASHGEIEGPRVIGALDALLERPRTETALALTPLDVMSVDVHDWLELLEESFDLACLAIRSLARRALQVRAERPAAVAAVATGAPAHLGTSSDLVERTALLLDLRPLRGAGVKVAGELAARSHEVAFGTGDVLHRQRSARDRVLLVIEGAVTAIFERPAVVLRAAPGEFVGWPAIYDDVIGCDAVASSPGRALAIAYDDWLDVQEMHFDMVRSALKALALACEANGD
jgi:CRP-like cAMP-binding protein